MVRRASPTPPSLVQTLHAGQDAAAAVPEEDVYREDTDGRSIEQAMPNQLLPRPPRPPSPLLPHTIKRAKHQCTAVERAVADHADAKYAESAGNADYVAEYRCCSRRQDNSL